MTAHTSVRAIVSDVLNGWGVAPDTLERLDTKTRGGKARLSLARDSAAAALKAPGRARFALSDVVVRAGDSLELDVPSSTGADLVANRIEIEPGGELVIAAGSRFLVNEFAAGANSQLTIRLKNGRDGLSGRAPSNPFNGRSFKPTKGGDAPPVSHLPFLAATITGTFTLKLVGGRGGQGGYGDGPDGGQDGADGGAGCDVGSITILYDTSTMTGQPKIDFDLRGGEGGLGGTADNKNGKKGRNGTVAQPELRQLKRPNGASEHTKSHNDAIRSRPVFKDPAKYEATLKAAREGFLHEAPRIVRDDNGHVVWDLDQYAFLGKPSEDAPPSVNPILWRNGQLNYLNGLFEVKTYRKPEPNAASLRIFQVRGLDLAVVTFIEADKSFIVIDPLTTAETAKAAWALVQKEVPGKPIRTIIYSHSHVDHDGGVRGLVSAADTLGDTPKVKIVAPAGFMEEATSENIYAGNAMIRRAGYMYGNLLARGPRGQVGAALGLGVSTGTVTLIAPNQTIEKDCGDEFDGIEVKFQLTPGTEAPAEMNIYFPQYKTLHIAENCTHTLHNVLTLRGAKVRDSLAWAGYLTETMETFGKDMEVLIAAHHWPTWGREAALEMIESQRDLYKFLNDQVLQRLNQGYTLHEIGNMMKLPKSLDDKWYNQDYYGTINHNSKAVYQRYIGWFDAVPAHLHPLDPADEAVKYVEYMGGAENVMTRARRDLAEGRYRWVASVMNQLVFAEPTNQTARDMLADAYEQLGYQAISAPWRNFYLSGAQELRNGVAILANPNAGSADTLRAMSMPEFLTFMAILVDAERAQDLPPIGLRLELWGENPYPESEDYFLSLKNSVLMFRPFDKAKPTKVDATLGTTRNVLNAVIGGQLAFDEAVNVGIIEVRGDLDAVKRFASVLIEPFDQWFDIVSPRPRPKSD